jgi:hypothetical protein
MRESGPRDERWQDASRVTILNSRFKNMDDGLLVDPLGLLTAASETRLDLWLVAEAMGVFE